MIQEECSVLSKKAKSTALVLLNDATRQRCQQGFGAQLSRLAQNDPSYLTSPAYREVYTALCRDVALDVRRALAFKSPSHARVMERLVAHPEQLYHESILEENGIYTYPLLFGLLYFSLTRRTPKTEDLQIVQQYFTKFLCEIAEGQPS